MLIAFTDESYSEAHYYQVAFVINEQSLALLDEIFEETFEYINGFGIRTPIELHGNEIMSSRKGWEPLGTNFRSKSAIFRFIFQRIAQLEATLLVQGVDVKKLRNRYRYPMSPHEVTHRNLMDSIDRFAEMRGEKIRIVSDQIDTQIRLETLFAKYKIFSTGGPYPRFLTSIEAIEHVESHRHPGVQIADLCAFIFRRLDEHQEGSMRTRREVVALWEILTPLINPELLPRVWCP